MRDQCFISGGENTLKVWRINPETRKVYGMNVKVGKIKRYINCIVINNRDELAYCGTASGDIIKARYVSAIMFFIFKIQYWKSCYKNN